MHISVLKAQHQLSREAGEEIRNELRLFLVTFQVDPVIKYENKEDTGPLKSIKRTTALFNKRIKEILAICLHWCFRRGEMDEARVQKRKSRGRKVGWKRRFEKQTGHYDTPLPRCTPPPPPPLIPDCVAPLSCL